MAARRAAGRLDLTRERWVNVTWMPHSALSQTSYICLKIKSAHAVLDDVFEDENRPSEWGVRISVYGIGDVALSPLCSHTSASPVKQRRNGEERNDIPLPSVSSATHDCVWEAMVHVPMRWRDLPRDSYLYFEIVDCISDSDEGVLYRGKLNFFSQYGKLLTGIRRLNVQQGHPNTKYIDEVDDNDPLWDSSIMLEELRRLEGKGARSSFREPEAVPWLDKLLKERAQEVVDAAVSSEDVPLFEDGSTATAVLVVELPTFDIPILYEESFYPVPQNGASGAVTPLDLALHSKRKAQEKDMDTHDPLELVPFLEYENENENPVEEKYRTLAHDLIRGLVDPALKPDKEQRARLTAIIDSPSHHPTREEKDLLWRFRFSLVDNRRALAKFLLAVDWSVESEVVQAAELLEQWRKRSPIEITDALKLLGKHVAFQTNLVRDYAIDTLAGAPDSELGLYLLQLVQALKYENVDSTEGVGQSPVASAKLTKPQSSVSSLASFLIRRAAGNMQLANFLYWYLKVEVEHPTHGARYKDVLTALQETLSRTPYQNDRPADWSKGETPSAKPLKSIVDSVSKKIGSSIRGSDGGTPRTEGGSGGSTSFWSVLTAQEEFIAGLLDVQLRCRDTRGKKDAKEAELRSLLAKEGFDKDPKRFAVPLPSAPALLVNGVHPETAIMFKSALYPALIEFHVEGAVPDKNAAPGIERVQNTLHLSKDEKSMYKVIVKTGDDLRQDQLCMMMIQLMDRLLKRAALDLCLTPYSIIATSPSSGLVEFVPNSMPISQVLAKHNNSILQFFQTAAPDKGAKYDVKAEVMATYVRSLAGYCVITYLLGIGDRHLDNILVRSSGHFFHIDFGFIFGRDPKPLPPAFRLTREMVDGMGGSESAEYRQFCSLACQAFNALRKSAGLVLNLVNLMSDAGIEDLSNNPAGDADFVIETVEKRFRLDLSDEEAERYFTGLINDCMSAIAPRVMDVFHSFAVSRR